MFPLFYRSVAVPPGVALLKAYEPKVDLRAGLVDHPETQSIHITSHLHVSASQRYSDKTEASEIGSDTVLGLLEAWAGLIVTQPC